MNIQYYTHRLEVPFKNFLSKMIFDHPNQLLTSITAEGDLPTVHTDQHTIYHKRYYEQFKESAFVSIYESFLRCYIAEIIGEPFLYQTIPNLRIQAPKSIGVGEFHRDRDYSHSPKEINIFLPITNAFGNATIWTETSPGLEDFIPLNCPAGGFYVWNGSNLLHGNKINDTSESRVSIDFRILPKRFYNDSNIKKSVTNGTSMDLGGYWSDSNRLENNNLNF